MLEKVEVEIKNISHVSVEDSMRRFRQTAYLSVPRQGLLDR